MHNFIIIIIQTVIPFLPTLLFYSPYYFMFGHWLWILFIKGGWNTQIYIYVFVIVPIKQIGREHGIANLSYVRYHHIEQSLSNLKK